MAPRKTSTYSMLHVVATLDGLRMVGFWEGDDALQVSPGADIGQGLVGAAGDSIFSVSADRSAQIMVRLQHTSATHKQLLTLLAVQKATGRGGFPIDIKDTGSGEGGSADQCFIQVAADDVKGANAGVREWTLWTGDWKPEIPY